MAIVITNGKLYMYLNEYGKHRKTDDITKAIQYKSKCEAVSYMYKAPSKTKGFYVYDTTDNIVLWERKNDGALSPGVSDILFVIIHTLPLEVL
jgi:hypothetical protein